MAGDSYPGNQFKTPLARSLNKTAVKMATRVMRTRGMVLPCKVLSVSGSIVKVSFEVSTNVYTIPNITCPLAYPEYIRLPIQVGDKGIVIPSDVSLGNASGLGDGGLPNIDSTVATLSDVMFLPLSKKSFSETDDPDALVLYGPNGVILRDTSSSSVINVSSTGVNIKGDTVMQDDLTVTGAVSCGNGATGTFTSANSKTITVQHGIITSIV